MLNVYRCHTDPESLHDYENRWKIDLMYAVDVLIQHPDRKDVERVVLTNSIAILKYVKATAKPFPAGLRVLIALNFNILPLISYAEAINQRLPEIEQELLSSGLNLVDYAERVIKGVWKEAEPIIAKDKSTRRVYIQKFLGGNWSKFDKGQFSPEDDWQDMVSSAIETAIQDINDNVWASLEEDEYGEAIGDWSDISLICKNITENKMRVYRETNAGPIKVGEINKISKLEVACKDDKLNLICKISIAGTDDEISDDIHDYVYSTLAGL